MNKDFKEILITEEQLNSRVKEIGKAITEKYKGQDLTIIGLLKGSYVFTADIARNIDNPSLNVEFIVVSSYENGESTKEIKILLDLKTPIRGKNVVIVEDIVDTGRTLSAVKQTLLLRGAKTVEIAAMCTKPQRRVAKVDIDYPSFVLPNEVVVGYGLDYNERYRHLPFVASVTEKFKKDNLK